MPSKFSIKTKCSESYTCQQKSKKSSVRMNLNKLKKLKIMPYRAKYYKRIQKQQNKHHLK